MSLELLLGLNSLLLLLQFKIKSLKAEEVSPSIVSAKNGCPIYDPTSDVDQWTESDRNTQTSSMDSKSPWLCFKYVAQTTDWIVKRFY